MTQQRIITQVTTHATFLRQHSNRIVSWHRIPCQFRPICHKYHVLRHLKSPNFTPILHQQRRAYAPVIRKRPNVPSPYTKSIKFMIYFFSVTGFFFFILTRVDDSSEKLTNVDETNADLQWRVLHRKDLEACLQNEQLAVLPCLNRLYVQEELRRKSASEDNATASPESNAYLADVLVEMAQKCDQLMELSKADEFYNEAAETGDARALLAYGTYLYDKSRELERAEGYVAEAVKKLDPQGFEDMTTASFRTAMKERRKKGESLFLNPESLHTEKERYQAHLMGAAWNNLGMIYKSKAAQNPQNLDLSVMVMKCFQRAAYFGDINGAYNIGMMYMVGRSSAMKQGSNYPLARKYFEHSGTMHAKLQLAKLSESGLCTRTGDSEPDLLEAYELYKEAFAMGYGPSRFLKQMLKLTYIVVISTLFKNSRPGDVKK